MEDFHIADAVEVIFSMLRRANKYIDETTPWTLAKNPDAKERLGTVLYNLLETVRQAAVLLTPFLPSTAEKIFAILGTDKTDYASTENFGALEVGKQLGEGCVLFARIDEAAFLAAREAEAKAAEEKKAEKKPEPKKEEEERPGIITIDDFMNVDLRAARVVACEKIPKAKKLLRLEVDLGDEVRQVVSGIALQYEPEDLIGKTVIVVSNLAPAKLCGIESRGMLLASGGDRLRVVFLDPETPLGERIR